MFYNINILGLGKFLAEGLEREVYLHPLSADRVIKIGKPSLPVYRNIVELEFYRRYCGDGPSFIPRIIGWVETERGYELEVELVSDMHG